MTDFAAARQAMVDCQVRPSDVTRYAIIEAMLWAPRERFVARSRIETAYARLSDDLMKQSQHDDTFNPAMQKLNEAYAVLSKPELRRDYDRAFFKGELERLEKEARALLTKIEAFAVYRNELQKYPHPWSREGLKLLSQYHGMQCGCPNAEAYQIIRGHMGLLP